MGITGKINIRKMMVAMVPKNKTPKYFIISSILLPCHHEWNAKL